MQIYPVIHPELTWRLLDGEAVIVSPTTGEIRVLNQAGADIWQQIVTGSQVQDIERALARQYALSPQQAEADVSAFLEDLTNHGLITWESRKA
ncbi:MAG: PqqD family protein [Anaerolineae bacterium]|nr:PqqD family protein [Anaerolineae bacterium]